MRLLFYLLESDKENLAKLSELTFGNRSKLICLCLRFALFHIKSFKKFLSTAGNER